MSAVKAIRPIAAEPTPAERVELAQRELDAAQHDLERTRAQGAADVERAQAAWDADLDDLQLHQALDHARGRAAKLEARAVAKVTAATDALAAAVAAAKDAQAVACTAVIARLADPARIAELKARALEHVVALVAIHAEQLEAERAAHQAALQRADLEGLDAQRRTYALQAATDPAFRLVRELNAAMTTQQRDAVDSLLGLSLSR